jgi:CBS domain-containing protein
MSRTINDVMTHDPVTLPPGASLEDAARCMRDHAIGDVLVAEDDQLHGMVTDRDIVVRALAEGRDPARTTVGEVCTAEVIALAPADDVDEAIRLMSDRAVRRVPVVEHGRLVGIVAMGDLAIARDPESALADVSAAAPNS